jgi:phage tail protein X
VAAGSAASLARPGEDGVATAVIVEKGDSLLQLAWDVYGFADERVLQVVLAANPDLGDPDRLLVGSAVRFPAIPGLGAGTSRER